MTLTVRLYGLIKTTNLGTEPMVDTTKAKSNRPTYTFRTGWALLLLAINFLVAAYYFHIIE